MSLSKPTLKAIVEAMLFVSERPLSLRQIMQGIKQAHRREAEMHAPDTLVSEPLDLNVSDLYTSVDQTQFVSQATGDVFVSDDETPQADVDAVLGQLMNKSRELDGEISRDEVRVLLEELADDYAQEGRGVELVQVAKGYQLRTKLEVSYYLRSDRKTAFVRLSPSSMETLAIVAYKQPVSRSGIEGIRGVDTGGVLKTLLDRELLRIVGRAEEPGRPLVYGTTVKFLEVFGLNTLKDLPNPAEFIDMGVGAKAESDDGADDEQGYFESGDFMMGEDVDLGEADQAILDELDQSLSGLAEAEKALTVFGDGKSVERDGEVSPDKNSDLKSA